MLSRRGSFGEGVYRQGNFGSKFCAPRRRRQSFNDNLGGHEVRNLVGGHAVRNISSRRMHDGWLK